MNDLSSFHDPIFCHPVYVPPEAIDTNGHVNNVVYVQWMQDAAVAHSAHTGGTAAAQALGATWVVRSHSIEYLRPAFAGDRLEIRTWVRDVRRARSTRSYEFFRLDDGTVLARGHTLWVFVDASTGRPRAIPDAVSRCYPLGPDCPDP